MAKRKAVMKDIIYELDNDDIEISSDDEVIGPKANLLELKNKHPEVPEPEKVAESEHNGSEEAPADSSQDVVCVTDSPPPTTNGGKIFPEAIVISDSPDVKKINVDHSQAENETEVTKKSNLDCSKTTIFNEDIEIDSPASNELRTAGCENRTPLLTVRFSNSKLASSYKERIKEFMIKLIKEHEEENSIDSDDETDLELDIWPDDIAEESVDEEKTELANGLFFVDTAPCEHLNQDIPEYSQVSSLISNVPEKVPSPPKIFRRPPTCFNCDGAHSLRDCRLPRNNSRIEEKRKTAQKQKVGRYHIEDQQKYGHLIPGRISGQLRHALGLKRNELPLHIYRMRMLGYPPGWLEEARISHSGITMFDSLGNAIVDPDEEDGEISEAGSKDKFDIKKILDFPGFNVPASSRYQEQAHLYNLPPMSEQDSKIAMLQMLAPNAMKAYKRKKLTFFPSSTNNSYQEGQAEMELDSGDEAAVFPSVPPLPDEAPPPLPPPPPPPPTASPPPSPPSDSPAKDKVQTSNNKPELDGSTSDVEIINVMQVAEIPMPEDSLIILDEDNDDAEKALRCSSPTLDDLEKKKRKLLEALDGDVLSLGSGDISISDSAEIVVDKIMDKKNDDVEIENDIESQDDIKETTTSVTSEGSEGKNVNNDEGAHSPVSVGTPEPKAGHVKTTLYGTPVLNTASPYLKLPSDNKFAKDICDIINFENLPNSIGKYKQICSLLKKVKNEVDRIQDS